MEKITKEPKILRTEKEAIPVELTSCQAEIESLSKKLNIPIGILNETLDQLLVSGQEGKNYPTPEILGK